MKIMKSSESAILEGFNTIMTSKKMIKTAQMEVQPLSEDEKNNLQNFLRELQTDPANGVGMERWLKRLKGQADPYLQKLYNALSQRYQMWLDGKDKNELSMVPLPNVETETANVPAQQATKGATLSKRHNKTADKLYDVFPKEDIVENAHPQTSYVEDEVVENLNEQQKADKAVAEKSAKDVLKALYKLAKQLKAEGKEEPYKMVKQTFMDISSVLKK